MPQKTVTVCSRCAAETDSVRPDPDWRLLIEQKLGSPNQIRSSTSEMCTSCMTLHRIFMASGSPDGRRRLGLPEEAEPLVAVMRALVGDAADKSIVRGGKIDLRQLLKSKIAGLIGTEGPDAGNDEG